MQSKPAEQLRTAWARRGLERESAIAVAKTISATLASYAFAVGILDSQVAVFAPFAAFFTVQSTIYRSLTHAIRYLVAVVIGVVAAGIVGGTLGQNFWTLAILVIVTVLIGQWRGFAGYGPQIAIVGLFAFGVGGSDEAPFLADLLVTVLAGALTGLAANLVFTPQLRFNDAAQTVEDVATAVQDLLTEIAQGLRSDEPLDDAQEWRDSARELARMSDRVHSDLDFGEESIRLNPRRLAMTPPPFSSSRAVIVAISTVVAHTESIARVLLYIDRSDGNGLEDSFVEGFLLQFADLLEPVAATVAAFGQLAVGGGDDFSEHLDTAYRRHQELTQSISDARPSDSRMLADCGAMLMEVERLLSELEAKKVQ